MARPLPTAELATLAEAARREQSRDERVRPAFAAAADASLPRDAFPSVPSQRRLRTERTLRVRPQKRRRRRGEALEGPRLVVCGLLCTPEPVTALFRPRARLGHIGDDAPRTTSRPLHQMASSISARLAGVTITQSCDGCDAQVRRRRS